MSIIILGLFVFTYFLDFFPLRKSGSKKDMLVYLIFMAVAVFLAVIFIFNISLSNPLEKISDFMSKSGIAYPEN